MNTGRRLLLAAAAAGGGLAAAAAAASTPLNPATPTKLATRQPTLRAPRLRAGDTLALVSPSSALYEREPYTLAIETLQAMGFKVREAPHLRARYGHFAGTDAQRASDLNAMFADPSVQGILAMTGGSGANRILPLLDYGQMRRTPKFLGGFSDITALLNAVQARSGLVTFHCPVAESEWNRFSLDHFRATVMDGQTALLTNPKDPDDHPVPRTGRITTLRGGKARGPLLGGNLAVLTSMAGSPYWPVFDGAILVLEDINEYIYRVDRMLSTLMISGVLQRVAGVVLGAFTKCEPGDGRYGTLTLDEVFDDYFLPLKVPVYRGALFGHIRRKITLPVGLDVEIDADGGSIRYLQPAVT